jgi:hypothetical protein
LVSFPAGKKEVIALIVAFWFMTILARRTLHS